MKTHKGGLYRGLIPCDDWFPCAATQGKIQGTEDETRLRTTDLRTGARWGYTDDSDARNDREVDHIPVNHRIRSRDAGTASNPRPDALR